MPDARPVRQYGPGDLLLVRHAPAATGGRLCGRADPPLPSPGETIAAAMAALGRELAPIRRRAASPARRCVETARRLWPSGPAPETDPRLWEQHFGAWEGRPYSDLPDLGPLARPALAARRPPGGESFNDLCDRALPALWAWREAALAEPVAIVAHAGTVGAALAMVLGSPAAGLAFAVEPLSLTHLHCSADGGIAVVATNRPAS